MRVASLRWAQGLLAGFQQRPVEGAVRLVRALSAAPDRTALTKYDGDILHIIKQYPGCSDVQVLAFLCARVHWIGRGTFINRIFQPSLDAVHAAGRRLEIAGEIKIRVDRSQHRDALRHYPNNPLWPDTDTEGSLNR
jgi:hypothetical protein